MLKKFLFDELRVIVNQYERLAAKRGDLNEEDVLCRFLTPRHNEALTDLARLTALYRASDPDKGERDAVWDRLQKAHQGMREWGRALEAAGVDDGRPITKVTAGTAIDICINSIQAIEKILGWTDTTAKGVGSLALPKSSPEPRPTELKVTLNQFEGVSPQISALAAALKDLPGGDSRPLPELGVGEQLNVTRWFADVARIIQAANVKVDAARAAAQKIQEDRARLEEELGRAQAQCHQFSVELQSLAWVHALSMELGADGIDSPSMKHAVWDALRVSAAARETLGALRQGMDHPADRDRPTSHLLLQVVQSVADGRQDAGLDASHRARKIDAERDALIEREMSLAWAVSRLKEEHQQAAAVALAASRMHPNQEAFADADEGDWRHLAEVMAARRRAKADGGMKAESDDCVAQDVGIELTKNGELEAASKVVSEQVDVPGVME